MNVAHLKQKIEAIFEPSDISFVGKIINENAFKADDKWTYIKKYVPNFKRKTAYLKGEIRASRIDTSLKLNMMPNPIIAIFPILAL
ncbi:MAG: hypothetical protein ABI295_08165 [Xanthomarina sp.]